MNIQTKVIILFLLTLISSVLKLNLPSKYLNLEFFLFNFTTNIILFVCFILITYNKSSNIEPKVKNISFYTIVILNIFSIIMSILKLI